jgi:tetratricopeptide (TPR) repeat protein
VLPAETDPILDYNDSLKAYRRDDAWRAGVVGHFEFNLRRMAELARGAKVPAILVIEPSNLGDCPPFKSEHSDGLTAAELKQWERLIEGARGSYRGDLQKSVALLKEAAMIDPRHAATWYELGKAYQALGLHERAREAFWTAREQDVCPLRMPSALEAMLRDVADDEEVPLIDSHRLLEARCADGILDNTMLVDHVHPTFEGHQIIADALLETMAEQGWVRPRAGWSERAQAEYQRHLDALDSFYFLKGQRTIEAVRGWAQGRAKGAPAAGRFPGRIRERPE